MTRFEWLIRLSLAGARQAWKLGHTANWDGFGERACPYAKGYRRAQWLAGWKQGERDREAATE